MIFGKTMDQELFFLQCLSRNLDFYQDVSDLMRAVLESRRGTDKLATIRDIFESFVYNSDSAYNKSEFVTNDEMFSGFQGTFNFRICIYSLHQTNIVLK